MEEIKRENLKNNEDLESKTKLTTKNLLEEQLPYDALCWEFAEQGDRGLPFIIKYPDSESSKAFKTIIKKIKEILENKKIINVGTM